VVDVLAKLQVMQEKLFTWELEWLAPRLLIVMSLVVWKATWAKWLKSAFSTL
jgi:hypothetical protein